MPIGYNTHQHDLLNISLQKARNTLIDIIRFFESLMWSIKDHSTYVFVDSCIKRLKSVYGDINEIPFQGGDIRIPPKALFVAKKLLREMIILEKDVQQKHKELINTTLKNLFKSFFDSIFKLVDILDHSSKESQNAPYEALFIKIRRNVNEVLGQMRDLVNRCERGFSRTTSSEINKHLNYVYSEDKRLIPLIISLSDIAASKSLVNQPGLRQEFLNGIQEVKETRAVLKSRINQLYQRKIKEEQDAKRSTYKQSLYSGKGGEFNRNTGFSEKGRFGGLDLDSRLMVDMDFRRAYIKRYVDKKVRAYLKRLKAIR